MGRWRLFSFVSVYVHGTASIWCVHPICVCACQAKCSQGSICPSLPYILMWWLVFTLGGMFDAATWWSFAFSDSGLNKSRHREPKSWRHMTPASVPLVSVIQFISLLYWRRRKGGVTRDTQREGRWTMRSVLTDSLNISVRQCTEFHISF